MYHCILLDLKLRRKSALRKSPHSNSSCSCIKEIFNLLHSSDCMISCNRVRLIPFRFFSFSHLHATKEISSMRTPITVTVYISNSSLWMCSSKFQGNWQIVFGFLDNQKFLFRGLRVVSRQALRRKSDCVTLQCWNSNLRLWLRRSTSIILSKLARETIEISNQWSFSQTLRIIQPQLNCLHNGLSRLLLPIWRSRNFSLRVDFFGLVKLFNSSPGVVVKKEFRRYFFLIPA